MDSVKEEWNKVIAEKLKQGVNLDDLKHEYPSGIIMEPNILGSDIEAFDHIVKVNSAWINMASIQRNSSIDKNTLALQSLQEGANGLSIELTKNDSIADILNEVMTEYLDVRIDASQLSSEEIDHQKSLLPEKDFPNIRWINQETNCKQFDISKENRVQSIRSVLEQIDLSKPADIIVTLSKNLLFEIASLRAIRSLVDSKGVSSFNILARYDVEGSNTLEDYNLIEKTYKILSGILGGANAILTPYFGDEDSRLTLNIHNVLDLESGMKNVLDPLSGSFYIEKLTGEIIRQVNEGL